jgi:hypothetical protein
VLVASQASFLQREAAIDFCYHYTPEYIDWVAPKPLANPKWPAIFKPFTPETWTATMVFAGENMYSSSKLDRFIGSAYPVVSD